MARSVLNISTTKDCKRTGTRNMRYGSPLFYSFAIHMVVGLLVLSNMGLQQPLVSIERSKAASPVLIQFAKPTMEIGIEKTSAAALLSNQPTPQAIQNSSSLQVLPQTISQTVNDPESTLSLGLVEDPNGALANELALEMKGIVSSVPGRFVHLIAEQTEVKLERKNDEWKASIQKSSGLPMLDRKILRRLQTPKLKKEWKKKLAKLNQNQINLNLNKKRLF